MLDESLRQRLEALNRERIPAPAVRTRPTAPPQVPKLRRVDPPHTKKQQALFERGEVVSNERGTHLAVRVPIAELWPEGDGLLHARHEQLAQAVDFESADVRQSFVQSFPSRFLGLDLETCGLSGSALFLVGLVRSCDDQFVVELLFARNYAEEAAVLCSLGERLSATDTLVTFNGKSFDWPMVSDRWRRYLLDRQSPLPDLVHYDVLHHARRKWRTTLPDCKLQTIERMICRRSRTGDIAGHLIPGAYDHYVQTGKTTEMEQVLYHNAIDLVTLLDVAMRLAG
ncbi:ribonuclease H-like domain-containing protein [Aeoliella sp. ICT_H6.2]|uniref:Ribonuclease H-like domain-containing protein n=1 Tax=Aeoliella straminimaris TaxID=2954799 RepID=A0A9X2FHL6_9BACT|nr:ribonuclease H-like domain-containing protein [Aeoliella straminimaris]MCO6047014.1 ribonuclease H-like domain-containing protein [Aeoliella straminimaris]